MPAFGKRWVALLLFWMTVVLMAAKATHYEGSSSSSEEELDILRDKDSAENDSEDLEDIERHFLKQVSLVPPFHYSEEGVEGYTSATDLFNMSGNAIPSNSFIRLISDHERTVEEDWERGIALSKDPIREIDGGFSAFLKFRLSGTNKHGVGVVLGLAFTTRKIEIPDDISASPHSGPVDIQESVKILFSANQSVNSAPFKGFAVIIDTSKAKHPNPGDIFMVYNNGSMLMQEMYSTAKGCNANFHYWENRDDVHISSVRKINSTHCLLFAYCVVVRCLYVVYFFCSV